MKKEKEAMPMPPVRGREQITLCEHST